MQTSSPLAAMQPPHLPFGHFGCRAGAQPTYGERRIPFGGRLGFGPSSFNFKDLSMDKASTDYFSLKPARGSSPTASLAADLSSNFHIDQSPQLPTPRRSLFSSNLFSNLRARESTRTPPPPSSSPGPGNDLMDISPLPHKAPYVAETRVEPTPTETYMEDHSSPAIDVMLGSPLELSRQSLERRRPNLLRPSLSRTRGSSTNSLSGKLARPESALFRFGSSASLQTTSVMSPEEPFTASPQRDRRPQSVGSPCSIPMGPPRLKHPFSNLGGPMRNVGQPIIGHVRKSSHPAQRPRKQFRRSLSMFEHPGDVMKNEKASFASAGLDAIMDIDDPPRLQLPHFNSDEESLPRITKETMIDVLDGKYNNYYNQSLIVDCRFEYEFEGGHIEGAVNFNDKEQLATNLFEGTPGGNTLLIFHCEYSAHRAPLMAKHIRHKDRASNAHRYPNLTYPEVYILDGGYSSFFADHKYRCFPQDYVEMEAKEHASACERGLGRIKQQRVKLSRAQTFAFGQHGQSIDDSPTQVGRQTNPLMSAMDLTVDSPGDPRRLASRRIASY